MTPRKGPPCPECGKVGCKSLSTFACWVRCFRRVLAEHGYARCGSNTVMLRKADIDLLRAPQPEGNEVWYAPEWALRRLDDLRRQAKADAVRRYGAHVEQALRADRRCAPPPPALLARMDELRAYALLRGWRFKHGTWYR